MKDSRDPLWAELELGNQKRASKKDRSFRLTGRWKKFVRQEGRLKLYAVDGAWIRSNLCIYFGHGGHGLVHEFIPMNEVRVSTHHYHESLLSIERCDYKTRTKNQKVSKAYFESTALHEIEEHEAGWLNDPFEDLE